MTRTTSRTIQPSAPTAAANRMRRYRHRRREEIRCTTIELHQLEIDALIQTGWLLPEMRNDADALRQAVHSFLGYRLLGNRDA